MCVLRVGGSIAKFGVCVCVREYNNNIIIICVLYCIV